MRTFEFTIAVDIEAGNEDDATNRLQILLNNLHRPLYFPTPEETNLAYKLGNAGNWEIEEVTE